MAGGRYPGSRVIPPRLPVEAVLPSGSGRCNTARVRRTLPVTVAGPRRIRTGFPSTDLWGGSLTCGGARGRRRHPRRLGCGSARRAAAPGRDGARGPAAVAEPLGDPAARHVLQLRALRAVRRRRGRPAVRIPRPDRRAGCRVVARTWPAAPRGTHARSFHVRGVPRQHRLPRLAVHRRAAGTRRAARGHHLRPARVDAVAAGRRLLDRRRALAGRRGEADTRVPHAQPRAVRDGPRVAGARCACAGLGCGRLQHRGGRARAARLLRAGCVRGPAAATASTFPRA